MLLCLLDFRGPWCTGAPRAGDEDGVGSSLHQVALCARVLLPLVPLPLAALDPAGVVSLVLPPSEPLVEPRPFVVDVAFLVLHVFVLAVFRAPLFLDAIAFVLLLVSRVQVPMPGVLLHVALFSEPRSD